MDIFLVIYRKKVLRRRSLVRWHQPLKIGACAACRKEDRHTIDTSGFNTILHPIKIHLIYKFEECIYTYIDTEKLNREK